MTVLPVGQTYFYDSHLRRNWSFATRPRYPEQNPLYPLHKYQKNTST
jgi:hypothetical protein